MRIAIAAMVGVVLAAITSFSVVQTVNASQEDPVIKPLYRYGSR